MPTIKGKHLTSIIFLCLGFSYFSVMSNLEVHYLLKSMIAIAPMQVGALIYVTYVNRFRQLNQRQK